MYFSSLGVKGLRIRARECWGDARFMYMKLPTSGINAEVTKRLGVALVAAFMPGWTMARSVSSVGRAWC